MSRRLRVAEDDEYEDDPDVDYGDDEATITCPYCGREIHEDSIRCPGCERYVSDEDTPSPRKPLWFIVGFLACAYVVWRWIFLENW